MDRTESALLDDNDWELLRDARRGYSALVHEDYDEVLLEIEDRIETSGSIGKLDIGGLLFWKRLRANIPWVADLLSMPEAEVRAITARAVIAVRNLAVSTPEAATEGRRALGVLPGVKTGDAFSSALLTAAAPSRMAVYDTRAQKPSIALAST